ncbi:hypothetical protein CU097_002677, partial [Rhizopus azygosporus]
LKNMKVISAVLFALGSLMVKSTVEGYRLMDYYSSRNCHSDLTVGEPPICLRMCGPEDIKCHKGWERKQFGHCWTCCLKEDDNDDDDYVLLK